MTKLTLKNIFKEVINEKKLDKSLLYECLNGAKSSVGGMKMNSSPLNRIEYREDKCLVNEAIDFEPSKNERGRIVVFSTDVNAVELSSNKLVNWIKQKIQTYKNRNVSTKRIDKIAEKHALIGWTIGHYLDGRYKAKNSKIYGENSLSVEIIGVDLNKLITIAEDLCRDFDQESVLVKDYSSGRVFFVNPE